MRASQPSGNNDKIAETENFDARFPNERRMIPQAGRCRRRARL
jgi:hypothetical protein